jgi:uncharacterized protein (TIGR02001 family)
VKKYLIAAAMLSVAAINSAQAVEITANGGAVTEYNFRGVPLSDGKAAAQGGFDLKQSGFYLGTWASTLAAPARIDNSDPVNPSLTPARSGMEVDLYAGYGLDLGDFNLGIGGTGYFYTDVFDANAYEVNLFAGWKFISVDYQIGTYDSNPTSQDYTFGSVTLEYKGIYGKYGKWGDGFLGNGSYFEVGYNGTLTVKDTDLFDFSFQIIRSDEALSFKVDENFNPVDETFFIAGVTKTFDLFSN